MTTGIVVFARMDSRRLPGKVLRMLAGRPVLGRLLDRMRLCRRAGLLAIATSDRPVDDPVAAFAAAEEVALFRGHAMNVLGRAVACADALDLDRLVRVSGDSPWLDPAIVDAVIELHDAEGPDIATNVFPRTWPPGQSAEVVQAGVLRRVMAEAVVAEDREHVTRYMYRHPDRYRIANLCAAELVGTAETLAIDTPEDLACAEWMVGQIADPTRIVFSDLLQLVRRWRRVA